MLKKKKHVLSTIVQMLDMITSINFNFLLFNIGDCTCIVHRYSVARLFVCVFCLYIIRTQHISRGDVTADLSRETSRCDVTFSRLYTLCYSETKDVITSKSNPYALQPIVDLMLIFNFLFLLSGRCWLPYS
jgi:hypothetical protein